MEVSELVAALVGFGGFAGINVALLLRIEHRLTRLESELKTMESNMEADRTGAARRTLTGR